MVHGPRPPATTRRRQGRRRVRQSDSIRKTEVRLPPSRRLREALRTMPDHFPMCPCRFRPLPPANDDEATCWFCLSSPKADLDMVVSIGEEIYMAIPKVRRGNMSGACLTSFPLAHLPIMSRLLPSLLFPLSFPDALSACSSPQGPLSPDHLLLMPIAHCSAMSRLSASAWGELERYKTALKA